MKKINVAFTILLSIFLACIINTPLANAFSFGKIEIKRTENFIAEIPVNVDGQSGLQVSIGSEKDYARFGIQRDKAIDNLSLYTEPLDKNRVIIKVYATQPINQPSFNLVIRASLSGGSILEKYFVSDFPKTVSLPPPLRDENVKPVISSIPPQMESKVEGEKDRGIKIIEKPTSKVAEETKTEGQDKLAKRIETKKKEIEPIDKTSEQPEKIGKDLYLIVGYKAWSNSWMSSADDLRRDGSGNQMNSDSVIASIPSISLKYKNFYISGGYFLNQQYTFQKFTDITNSQIQYKAERKEFDASIGYNVWRTVSLFVGYKEVLQIFSKYTNNAQTAISTDAFTSSNKYWGPILGIMGSYAPFDGKFSLYGSGSLGRLSGQYLNGRKEESNLPYNSIELGMLYQIESLPLSISIGYKTQTFNSGGGASGFIGKEFHDLTNGFLLGVNYYF